MKQFVFALLALWIGLPGQAQIEKDTLYGFREHISPGIKKAGAIDKNGRFVKSTSPEIVRYSIYFATASKAQIHPTQLWINGEAFEVSLDTLSHPPIAHSNSIAPEAQPRYLFPETKGAIYRLTPIPLIKPQDMTTAKSLVARNAIVFFYYKNGIMYYEVLKKFTDLPAVALQ